MTANATSGPLSARGRESVDETFIEESADS